MKKLCAKCGRLIEYPNRYCDSCRALYESQSKEAEKEANKNYNRKRDRRYLRFYQSKEWNILKNKYMQDKGYKCELCKSLATEVHHIEPIQTEAGWVRRLDYTNLMLVCVKCHNKIHGRFIPRKERKYEDKSSSWIKR